MDDLKTRVRDTIVQQFDLEQARLPEELDADSIAAWDSLGHLNLMNNIEETFGVRIPIPEAVELWNESAIVDAIARRQDGGA